MFCAFHPNREMVPSLPLRFARPEIPNCAFELLFELRLASIEPSEIISTRPAPNTGVGIRKTMFLLATWVSKSS